MDSVPAALAFLLGVVIGCMLAQERITLPAALAVIGVAITVVALLVIGTSDPMML
jgi:hypothetical protein